MAEHINNTTPLSSGGHVWVWGDKTMTDKRLRSVGVAGEGRIVLNTGGRPFQIEGAFGGPALLKATSAESLAAAETAMTALEAAIESLLYAGTAVTFEDDVGHTGSFLVITSYRPQQRERSFDGTTYHVWLPYSLGGVELAGRPPAA